MGIATNDCQQDKQNCMIGNEGGEPDEPVTDELVEIREINRFKFKALGKLPVHFGESTRIFPNLVKETRKVSTCDRSLGLEILGSRF